MEEDRSRKIRQSGRADVDHNYIQPQKAKKIGLKDMLEHPKTIFIPFIDFWIHTIYEELELIEAAKYEYNGNIRLKLRRNILSQIYHLSAMEEEISNIHTSMKSSLCPRCKNDTENYSK